MNAVRLREDASEARADDARLALSAFMDGEEAAPTALGASAEVDRDWDTYHLIGDIMRSPGLARPVSARFSERMTQALADEPPIVAAPRRPPTRLASRYGMHGVALAAAVAAVTWVVQPYFASPEATLQAEAPPAAARPAVMSASIPIDPLLADYFDAHRHMAGMGTLTQASLDVRLP